MKISVAQNRPVIGDIDANVAGHKKLIDLAATNGASVVVFPELSLSGYEPKIAAEVATTVDDPRFNDLQTLSNKHNIAVGSGIPIKNKHGITITMIIFQPGKPRTTYSKKYLHEDEEPFFVSGDNFPSLVVGNTKMSLAICYEISVPEHARVAANSNPSAYIASVAKFKRHMDNTTATLSKTAKDYSVVTMMSNCLGVCDGEECAGSSFAIDKDGVVIDQLDDKREGILIFDLDTKMIIKKYV
jgi:predicted amidohydrolase